MDLGKIKSSVGEPWELDATWKEDDPMTKANETERSRDLPLWKLAALNICLFGFSSGILTFIPEYSSTAMKYAVATGVIGAMANVGASKMGSWWARAAFGVLFSMQILAAGYRSWLNVIENALIWFLPAGIAFILAWLLPWRAPGFSEILWQEQTAPQTRAGKYIMRALFAVLPVLGVLGVSIGMFGSRFGEVRATTVLVGTLLSIVGLSLAFTFSYQLWPERPWASDQREAGEL